MELKNFTFLLELVVGREVRLVALAMDHLETCERLSVRDVNHEGS